MKNKNKEAPDGKKKVRNFESWSLRPKYKDVYLIKYLIRIIGSEYASVKEKQRETKWAIDR